MGEKLATLSVDQQEALEKDSARKEKKEEAKAEREMARIAVRPPLPFEIDFFWISRVEIRCRGSEGGRTDALVGFQSADQAD